MRSFRHQRQSGFTLIELVMVIVIIGILSAVAIPKFSDLANDAKLAAANGIAGNIATASQTNYAIRSGLGTTKGVPVTGCDMTSITALLEGGLPTGVTVSGNAAACQIIKDGTNASFTIVMKVII